MKVRLPGRRLVTVTLLGTVVGCTAWLSACTDVGDQPRQRPWRSDVVVVGAGPAGLAAALESADGGAGVVVVEANSVGGGHGVMAGGFAMVNTALQRKKNIDDSAELAYRDWVAYGETNDPEWTRRYAEESAAMVYDWLTGMGVEFRMILPTPENSVPRFHFTRGTSIHVMTPMLQRAFDHPGIRFLFNHRAERLLREDGRVVGVDTHNLRNNDALSVRADAVILATGGFQGNLDRVRASWPDEADFPDSLLVGGSRFAQGSGHDLAAAADAGFVDLDKQVVFLNGIPSPREPARALKASSPMAIWVNAQGERFVNESSSEKIAVDAVLSQRPASYWAIFDANGRKKFSVRDAPWLNRDSIDREIIGNPALTQSADSIERLAADAGLPAAALVKTVDMYNEAVQSDHDREFGRFGTPSRQSGRRYRKIETAPFYAVRMFPMTRKNMGGVAIDRNAQVIDADGQPIGGLFAAGELTGVAGINGSYGMNGTFLGPAVFIGRVAGSSALGVVRHEPAKQTHEDAEPSVRPLPQDQRLESLVNLGRDGYRHFESSHRLVLERDYECALCHSADFAPSPPANRQARLTRLDSCAHCH